MRGRLAGSGLRPWPFFLGASEVGVGAVAGSGSGSEPRRVLELGLRQDFLGEEQELSGVDPLGLLAVALAEELFELVLELLVEMDLLAQRLQQLADELMGRFQIVWEWVRDGDHTLYYVDGCWSVCALFSEF